MLSLKMFVFCDSCFGKFMHKQNKVEKIEVSRRYKWLQEHKLLRKYYSHLESEFTKVITNFRIKIQAQNPQLVLGNLNYVNTWFFRAMLKGLGTKAVPAISAPESPTYRQGYIPFVDKQQRSLNVRKSMFFMYPESGICVSTRNPWLETAINWQFIQMDILTLQSARFTD